MNTKLTLRMEQELIATGKSVSRIVADLGPDMRIAHMKNMELNYEF